MIFTTLPGQHTSAEPLPPDLRVSPCHSRRRGPLLFSIGQVLVHHRIHVLTQWPSAFPEQCKPSDRDQARELLCRLDALIDVQLAQLAHTDADSPRWQHLRAVLAAETRLRTGLSALSPERPTGARQVAVCVLRWLRRVEPALGLIDHPVPVDPNNDQLFRSVKTQAERQRAALSTLRRQIGSLPDEHIDHLIDVGVGMGLGQLTEVLTDETVYAAEPYDPHIQAMLLDAEAWCAPRGGQNRAAVGMARLAEAALLAHHVVPDLEPRSLFGRYVGAPDILLFADLRPDHVLAFDAVVAGSSTQAPPLRLAEQQLSPEVFAAARDFFESRMSIAADLQIAFPNRTVDALNVRLSSARMRSVAAAFSGPLLEQCCRQLGPESLTRALVYAGPPAVASLAQQLGATHDMQAILTAFEPVGHAVQTLLKTVAARHLRQLVDAVGPVELGRQIRALGADGLKHVFDCVGMSGSLVILSARATEAQLEQLREDLGRRSVRLTLQAAGGTDAARLIQRGISARQLQALMLGAEQRAAGLGQELVRRLASLPGTDAQLQQRIETLCHAMGWPTAQTLAHSSVRVPSRVTASAQLMSSEESPSG